MIPSDRSLYRAIQISYISISDPAPGERSLLLANFKKRRETIFRQNQKVKTSLLNGRISTDLQSE